MTQMPQGYYQQPAYPQQPQYAPPPQFPQAPPQGYYQQPVPQAPPTPPPAPVASGTIDQFYSQPSAAGGPGISWKDKQLGTTYAGIISGVCRVQQDTDFDTGRPLFQRDQVTPKWVMLIPLSSVQSNVPTAEFPDGEAVFYVRGQARDELVRAMGEAGCSGEPQAGAAFQVTLTQRKPNRKGNPSNIVQIKYVPPGGVAHQAQPAAETEAASPAPEQLPQQAPVQQVQPTQQFQPAQYPQVATQPQQPTVDQTIQQQGPPPQWAGQPIQQPAPQGLQPSQPQAPVQQTAPQPPPGLDPKRAELLARLTGGQTS